MNRMTLLAILFNVFGMVSISIETTIAYVFFGIAVAIGLIDIYRSMKKK